MVIIFNPTAGRRRHHQLRLALEALRAAGIMPEVRETQQAGDATRLARCAARDGAAVIVAAGGDGTIAEVAQGLSGSGACLGLLPMGTANVLARELAIPLRPDAAARILAQGDVLHLHPGQARFADGSTRIFVQMLGTGFDAAVVASLDLGMKRRLGRAAYVWQTMRELARYRFPGCTVTLDGVPTAASSVIVTKGRLYAGQYLLAPDARPDAPGFAVAILHHGGTTRTMLAGMALPLDLLPRLPGLTLHRAHRVALSGAGMAVQMDGDPAGALPVEIVDAATPIPVLVAAARHAAPWPAPMPKENHHVADQPAA